MAKFCRFCGKEINGGTCDCAEAQQELRMKAQGAAAGPVPAGAGAGSTGTVKADPVPAGQGAAQARETASGMKGVLFGIIRDPLGVYRAAAEDTSRIYQFIFTVIFAAVSFIFLMLSLGDLLDEWASIISFSITLLMLIVRYVHAVCIYVVMPKDSPKATFASVAGVFSITFILDTAILVLLAVFAMISIYELVIAILMCWVTLSALNSCLASMAFMDTGKAFKCNMIIQLVICILSVFIIRGIIVSAVGDVMKQGSSVLRMFR